MIECELAGFEPGGHYDLSTTAPAILRQVVRQAIQLVKAILAETCGSFA